MIKARIPAQDKENANLKDYINTVVSFSWEGIGAQMGLGPSFQNAYYHLVQKSLEMGLQKRHALLFDMQESIKGLSFYELDSEANRWANLFRDCGLLPRERVFFLLSSSPELYTGILGAIRAGLVVTPLYPTLTINELEIRISNGSPSCIVTNFELSETFAATDIRDLKALIYTDGPKRRIVEREFVYGESPGNRTLGIEEVGPEAPLYLIYTSGSVGPPKGILHAHRDIVSYYTTGLYALDLKGGDVLWVDGPIAWVTGLVYGLFTPLILRVPSVIQTRDFDPALWYQTIEKFKVTVWYTTPMTLRRLKDAGLDLPRRYDLSTLRLICSVGEALPAELFYWAKEAFDLYPHDTWWMTETGSICIANYLSLDLKPGSMGRPMPGIQAVVVDEKGEELPPMSLGELALKVPWPSMLSGIFRDEERFKEYFRYEGLFLTGDMAIVDEEGYFYHQGRVDDIIKIGDRMIGPFEVESVLVAHPAVSEAGVISKTTVEKGTFLKAFVALRSEFRPSLKLSEELKAYAKANIGLNIPLKEVEFMDKLPRTRAGKLLRRVLRAKELGIPIAY